MFPGTVGIKLETTIHVLTEIMESFIEQGFKKIILFTSHAQNGCPMEAALEIVSERCPEAILMGLSSITLGSKVRAGCCKAGPAGLGHALEAETSMTMVLQSDLVHMDRVVKGSRILPYSEQYIGVIGGDKSKGVLYYNGITGFEATGLQGDPSMSSPEEGELLIAGITDDFADIILEMAKR
jgi:creatinine amidohydrolase